MSNAESMCGKQKSIGQDKSKEQRKNASRWLNSTRVRDNSSYSNLRSKHRRQKTRGNKQRKKERNWKGNLMKRNVNLSRSIRMNVKSSKHFMSKKNVNRKRQGERCNVHTMKKGNHTNREMKTRGKRL